MPANNPQRVLITGAFGMLGYKPIQWPGDDSRGMSLQVLLRTVTPGIFSYRPAGCVPQMSQQQGTEDALRRELDCLKATPA